MRITRGTGVGRTVREIDFSRKLIFYSTIGFAVPVVSKQPKKSDVIFIWITDDTVITADGMKYQLYPGNPREFERLKNNVIALFDLNGLE